GELRLLRVRGGREQAQSERGGGERTQAAKATHGRSSSAIACGPQSTARASFPVKNVVFMRHVTPPSSSRTTVSPSDPLPAPPCVLAGRVVACETSGPGVSPAFGRAVVADAFDEREVTSIHGVSVGDLVEVEVTELDGEARCVASAARVVGRDVRQGR